MEIGKYNTLKVSRTSDHGVYLADGDGNEVLLPTKFVERWMRPGKEVTAFVHTDSDDRPIATTRRPNAVVGEVALMRVKAVNETGAFLDWGLEKDLLVPFREQRRRMQKGRAYLVYVYLDDVTGRVAATGKYEKYIDNTIPEYSAFQKVDAVVTGETEIGYKVVVNNLHSGMLYADQVYSLLEPGDRLTAYVRKVRADGKIDLTLLAPAADRTALLGEKIIARLNLNGGEAEIGDFLTPDYIAASFGCSKKDFKKAVGALLKAGRVAKTDRGLRLTDGKDV